MEIDKEKKSQSLIGTVLAHKAIIFIIIGIAIRVLMLIYYYYSHAIDPAKGWGDVELHFKTDVHYIYPPLTEILLRFFIILSFENLLILVFWAFLLDLLTMLMFYFVLKSFNIKNKNYAFGLFLINPFLFLNNSFSLVNCGYHMTDSFFLFFLFMALIFYPKEDNLSKYLFYLFLAFSVVIKLYTVPIIVLIPLKHLITKDWKEIKIFLITSVPVLFVFLIAPIFYWEGYLELYVFWNQKGEAKIPLYIRIIPSLIIFGFFILFKLKSSDIFEITIISIIILASFMIFSSPFIRYFQPIIFYGILKEKKFFMLKVDLRIIKREICVDNHIVTFYLSIVAVILAFIIITFIMKNPYY
jgi:hypothetical protein